MKKKINKYLNIILVLLLIGILGYGVYFVSKQVEKKQINSDATDFLSEFDEYIERRNSGDIVDEYAEYLDADNNKDLTEKQLIEKKKQNDAKKKSEENSDENNQENSEVEENTSVDANDVIVYDENSGDYVVNTVNGTKKTTTKLIATNEKVAQYKNYTVEGKIEMPVVGLNYPVLNTMTDAHAIDVAVAVQWGVGLNKVGNTVIVGHNYRSGLLFGSNKKMNVGDSVYITDIETGSRIRYEIYDKFDTKESDTSFYNRETNGKREISLVTCRQNNDYRLVLLAREAE